MSGTTSYRLPDALVRCDQADVDDMLRYLGANVAPLRRGEARAEGAVTAGPALIESDAVN